MKDIKRLIEEFNQGQHLELLKDIYVDERVVDYQQNRYVKVLEQYEELFGAGPVEVFSAPGRTEVGGNHTDHQHGMVLAASVNLDAVAVAARNDSEWIQVVSDGYQRIRVSLDDLTPKEEAKGTSAALIRGVVYGLRKRGYQVGGFDAFISSDVLIGAGLSSSAAFETILGTIVSGLFNGMGISMVEIAQVGQFAENVFFGKPCGLMDQTASAVGGLIHIDFDDPGNPVVNKVEVDFERYRYSLCIVDTKGSHADLTGDYAAIPGEMGQAAAFFGEEVLRDVPEELFYQQLAQLRKEMSDRCVLRAIHFYEEEKRVDAQVDALRKGEFRRFLQEIKESGNSSFQYLQNVYTNKDVRNQGVSVGLAVSESVLGEHGVCRVHGGGFAGTIQAFVENGFVKTYKSRMEQVFGEGACHVLKIRKYGGMKVL